MDDYWIHAILAVMVLLNFLLNLTSVYLGYYKKNVFEDYLQHIIEHICPAYEDEEEESESISELEKKLSKDKAQFEEWDKGG